MNLDQRSQTIVQRFLGGSQRLTVSLDAHMKDLHDLHDQSDALVQNLYQKTNEAINSFSSPTPNHGGNTCNNYILSRLSKRNYNHENSPGYI